MKPTPAPSDAKAPASQPRPTIVRRGPGAGALVLFAIVAGAALAADLVTKDLAFREFLATPGLSQQVQSILKESDRPLTPPQVLRHLDIHRPLGAGLRMTMSVNPGVVFGWDLPRWLVLLATGATVAIVALMLLGAPRRGVGQIAAIGLIFAGALGNLYDRLFSCVQLPGVEPIRYHVRDFIDATQLHYPYVFNIADVWLVAGVGYLLLHTLMPRRGPKPVTR